MQYREQFLSQEQPYRRSYRSLFSLLHRREIIEKHCYKHFQYNKRSKIFIKFFEIIPIIRVFLHNLK